GECFIDDQLEGHGAVQRVPHRPVRRLYSATGTSTYSSPISGSTRRASPVRSRSIWASVSSRSSSSSTGPAISRMAFVPTLHGRVASRRRDEYNGPRRCCHWGEVRGRSKEPPNDDANRDDSGRADHGPVGTHPGRRAEGGSRSRYGRLGVDPIGGVRPLVGAD